MFGYIGKNSTPACGHTNRADVNELVYLFGGKGIWLPERYTKEILEFRCVGDTGKPLFLRTFGKCRARPLSCQPGPVWSVSNSCGAVDPLGFTKIQKVLRIIVETDSSENNRSPVLPPTKFARQKTG